MVNHEEFHPPTVTERSSSKSRILVADDEECLRLLLTQVLESFGYVVDTVKDGADAWDALQSNPYDLLITDYKMPRVTGLELVRKVSAAHMNLPIVMVAGELPGCDIASDESFHLAAMVMKPFDLETFIETVKRVLRDAVQMA